MLKRCFLVAGLVLAASAAQAGDLKSPSTGGLPAVSAFNGKIEGFGGATENDGFGGISGSVVIPLAHSYGLQIDGLASSYDGDGLFGVGAHLFWRDPSRALFGIYADYGHWGADGGVDVARVAAEAELYLDRISLEGLAGGAFGDGNDAIFSSATLALYATPDLRLSIGHSYLSERHALTLGGEWQVSDRGVSLFTEGRIGEDDSNAILAGVRLYAAPQPKSLIDRHRQDDPKNHLTDMLGGLGEAELKCKPPYVLYKGRCVVT